MPVPERRPLRASPVGTDLAHAIGAFVVAQRRARRDRGAVLRRERRDVGNDMCRPAGPVRRGQTLLDQRAVTDHVGCHAMITAITAASALGRMHAARRPRATPAVAARPDAAQLAASSAARAA